MPFHDKMDYYQQPSTLNTPLTKLIKCSGALQLCDKQEDHWRGRQSDNVLSPP